MEHMKESGDAKGGQRDSPKVLRGGKPEQVLPPVIGDWRKVGGVHGHTRDLGGS